MLQHDHIKSIYFYLFQHSSRDSGLPSDWEHERWNRQRSDSISGSEFGGRVQRKLSNTSCPPPVKSLPHSASVFDLNMNTPMQHGHHGFVPVQQVGKNSNYDLFWCTLSKKACMFILLNIQEGICWVFPIFTLWQASIFFFNLLKSINTKKV